MVTGSVARPLGRMIGNNQEKESVGTIDLSSLSKLTGFPVDFIKKELVVDQEKMSVEELRAKVAHFLDHTLGGSVE